MPLPACFRGVFCLTTLLVAVCCGASAVLAEDVAGPLSPAETLSALTIAEDLEVTLFAAEPMVRNPAVMDIDARGRVWVAEGLNYRRYQEMVPEGDRILILEDTDGDGAADSSKVYYQGKEIDNALGLCVIGNKLIVSRSPHVFVFTDEDGDDVPDKKEVLFQGISGEQHDHGVHSFVFGPDGKFYFNTGNEGKQLLDSEGKPVRDLAGNLVDVAQSPYQQGMVFRCNLDGSEFETLAWNFRNNYEVAVDSFGTMWQSDNDDDGNEGVRINYVMEFGNFGYKGEIAGENWRTDRINLEADIPSRHWFQNDPGVVPNLLQTGWGSPTGMIIYEGDLLPERFRGQMIHCDPGPRVLRAYPVEQDGAGYSATIENLVVGRDTWFRPADVCIAPDGSLYVADWYDPGVGGHAMGDNDPNGIRGRVYRIAPKGHRPTVPEFDLSTPEACVETLKSPNHERRYLAWTRLREFERKAEPALITLWKDPSPRLRARALHLLARLERRGPDYVEEALADPDEDIRIAALRIAREAGMDVIPFVKMVLSDDSRQVRRECAIALRGDDSKEAADYWAELAALHPGSDRWFVEALGIGAEGQWESFFPAWLGRVGKGWDTAAGHDIVWRARGAQVPVYLVEILKQVGDSYGKSARYLRSLEFQPEMERSLALVQLARETISRATGSEGWAMIGVQLATRFEPSPFESLEAPESVLRAMAAAAEGTPQLAKVIDQFGLSDLHPMLLDYALEATDTQHVAPALAPLLQEEGRSTLMAALESEDVTRSVRIAHRLGFSEEAGAIDLLSAMVADTNWETPLRSAALSGLVQTQKGAGAVLAMAKEGRLPAEFQNLAAIKLNSAPGNWREIREEAPKVLPLPSNAEGEVFPPFNELASIEGNPERGREVFKQICMVCHKVQGEGIEFGPDLSNIGGKFGKDALYENILNPNSAVSFGYEPVTLVLGDVDEVYGFLVEESATELAVRNQQGEIVRVPRNEIQEIREEKLSAMPVGLEKGMSTQDFADLLEYLSGLRG